MELIELASNTKVGAWLRRDHGKATSFHYVNHLHTLLNSQKKKKKERKEKKRKKRERKRKKEKKNEMPCLN